MSGTPLPPPEFSPEYVQKASLPEDVRLCHDFNSSAEPAASLERQGLIFRPDFSSLTHLSTDDDHYYNTTGIATATYWSGRGLPTPTRDIRLLRCDLARWGFALVKDALSKPQLETMRVRTVEQAAGERAAGCALWLNACKCVCARNIVLFCSVANQSGRAEGWKRDHYD